LRSDWEIFGENLKRDVAGEKMLNLVSQSNLATLECE